MCVSVDSEGLSGIGGRPEEVCRVFWEHVLGTSAGVSTLHMAHWRVTVVTVQGASSGQGGEDNLFPHLGARKS